MVAYGDSMTSLSLHSPRGLALWTVALCGLAAAWLTDPAWRDPGSTMICHMSHPDCASNHWLLAWVAEQLASASSLAQNDMYYWPVGDAPFVAGNGGEGLLYAPFHWLWGWPVAASIFLPLLIAGNGIATVYLARAFGASPAGSLLAGATMTASVYALRELSSGRFSQSDLIWLLCFLAAWVRFLEHPTRRRAVIAAALLAVTSTLYWYYGFFGVLAGCVLWASRLKTSPTPLPELVVFSGSYLALIALPLWWFASHFSAVPGVAEAAFPHPEAIRDALVPAFPFTISSGRFVTQALPAVIGLGLAARCYQLIRTPSTRDWKDGGLFALGIVFVMLAMGPRLAFGPLGSPYEWLYGLASPLERFWWPSRHIVVASVAWTLLAARALPSLTAQRELLLGLGLFAAVFGSMKLQGLENPLQVTHLDGFPPSFYEDVGELEGEVLLTLPLAPEVAASQRHLLYQRIHKKRLVTGHALWVDRIRPKAWDEFVAQNTLLAGIQSLERGESHRIDVDAADLSALHARGLTVIVVNKEHYPARLEEVAKRDQAALTQLLGAPTLTGEGMWAWTVPETPDSDRLSAELPSWTWPPDLRPRADDTPISRHTVRSTVFRPANKAGKKQKSPAPPRGKAPHSAR